MPYFSSQLLKAQLPASASILDVTPFVINQAALILSNQVGCGAGLLTEALARARASYQFVGLDLSPGSVAAATKQAAKQGVTNVRYEAGSAYSLNFDDASFEGVVSSDVIEHMVSPLS